MSPIPEFNHLRSYFSGLTEFTFETHLGVADPTLIDYISELLTRFTHFDGIYRIKSFTGRPLDQVADMLLEAETSPIPARREIHRHIGDFTLFWSGMYPEGLRRLQAAPRKDSYLNYPELGKRAYRLASQIEPAEPPEENSVLLRLSHDFDLCVDGLQEVRREWESRGGLLGPSGAAE
jgi:hypothetical protein